MQREFSHEWGYWLRYDGVRLKKIDVLKMSAGFSAEICRAVL